MLKTGYLWYHGKLKDYKFKNQPQLRRHAHTKYVRKIFEAITDMINTDNLDSKLNDISNDLIKIKTVRNSLKIFFFYF